MTTISFRGDITPLLPAAAALGLPPAPLPRSRPPHTRSLNPATGVPGSLGFSRPAWPAGPRLPKLCSPEEGPPALAGSPLGLPAVAADRVDDGGCAAAMLMPYWLHIISSSVASSLARGGSTRPAALKACARVQPAAAVMSSSRLVAQRGSGGRQTLRTPNTHRRRLVRAADEPHAVNVCADFKDVCQARRCQAGAIATASSTSCLQPPASATKAADGREYLAACCCSQRCARGRVRGEPAAAWLRWPAAAGATTSSCYAQRAARQAVERGVLLLVVQLLQHRVATAAAAADDASTCVLLVLLLLLQPLCCWGLGEVQRLN